MTPSARLSEQLDHLDSGTTLSPDEWAFSDKIARDKVAPKKDMPAEASISPISDAPSAPPSAPSEKRRPARKPSARKAKATRKATRKAAEAETEPTTDAMPDEHVAATPGPVVRELPHAPGWTPEADVEEASDTVSADDAETIDSSEPVAEAVVIETDPEELVVEAPRGKRGRKSAPESTESVVTEHVGDVLVADVPVAQLRRRTRGRKPVTQAGPEPVVVDGSSSDDDQPDGARFPENTTSSRSKMRRPLLAFLSVVFAGVAVFCLLQLFRNDPKPAAPAPRVTQTDDVVARYALGEGGVKAGDDLGFRALFPGTPVRDASTRTHGGESVPFEWLSAGTEASAFQVERVVLPSWMDVTLPNSVIHKSAEGVAAAQPDGKLDSYRVMNIDGDPAAAFRVTASHGLFVRGRIVLHGRNLYVIRVVSDSDSPPGFDRFVRSFGIL